MGGGQTSAHHDQPTAICTLPQQRPQPQAQHRAQTGEQQSDLPSPSVGLAVRNNQRFREMLHFLGLSPSTLHPSSLTPRLKAC